MYRNKLFPGYLRIQADRIRMASDEPILLSQSLSYTCRIDCLTPLELEKKILEFFIKTTLLFKYVDEIITFETSIGNHNKFVLSYFIALNHVVYFWINSHIFATFKTTISIDKNIFKSYFHIIFYLRKAWHLY
jgi:hypothetical protein